MDEDQLEQWRALAALFSGLSHRVRVAILLGLYHGRSMSEIEEDLDITRGGMQNHIEKLIDVQLIYRSGESGAPYALTPLGVFFAVLVEEHQDMLLEAVETVKTAERQAREEFAEVPMSEDQIEQEVKRRKWDLVGEELENLLSERVDEFDDEDESHEEPDE